jgi:hypothetical protein
MSRQNLQRRLLTSEQGTKMSREAVRPFLITKDEDGNFRLTVRETRYNSQGYPLVTSHLQEETFKSAAAVRNFARDVFKAEPTQYATK